MSHHIHRHILPFSAIVGQDTMKLALTLNAINPAIGGVLIRGEKGTAKSSAVRALAEILPEIRVVNGCPFQCSPDNPSEMCDACHVRFERGEELPSHTRKVKVMTLPIGATGDRVVGTLNFERALKEGILALEPGMLAQVNRGVLYIDEVNLLDDHLVDLLLDAAASGVNIVEREGISVSHPAKFILIGTMNPEEGDLRPQLLDRFGLQVTVDVLADPAERIQLVRVCEQFEQDPVAFSGLYAERQRRLRERIVSAMEILPEVRISDQMVIKVIEVCTDLGIRTHRAELTIIRTAKTIAAFEGRTEVIEQDLKEAMKLAIPHRMRRRPFEEPHLDDDDLNRHFPQESDHNTKDEAPREEMQQQDPSPKETGLHESDQKPAGSHPPSSKTFMTGEPAETTRITERLRKESSKAGYAHGKTLEVQRQARQGSYRTFSSDTRFSDIALDATLRAAAPFQKEQPSSGLLVTVRDEDIRRKVRAGTTSTASLFVVDGSGSMGADRRMESAKGAILSLLKDSYLRRDKVGMVLFGGKGADLVLPLSSSAERAARCLEDLPTGGRTPLSSGLLKAAQVLLNEKRRCPEMVPFLFLISDGRANVGVNGNIREELGSIAGYIGDAGLKLVVIDTENSTMSGLKIRLGYCRMIAEMADGHYYHLDDLKADAVHAIAIAEQADCG
jgi:magnesium chelatase subunit D